MEESGDHAGTERAVPSWARADPGRGPLFIAHRGASALEPENSIAAFQRALSDGADGVELDVLLCASGEPIVFHDDDLARLGGQQTVIADLRLEDLRVIRLRSGATIPTLAEVFEACGGRMLVNVELKASGLTGAGLGRLVEAVAETIRRFGPDLPPRVLVSSFNPRALRCWRRQVPHVRTGLLFERQSSLPLRRAWALPWVGAFSAHPEAILCTARAVSRWHQRGYRVNVWTVDAADDLRRFAGMAVDGIITNDPARSRQALLASRPPP